MLPWWFGVVLGFLGGVQTTFWSMQAWHLYWSDKCDGCGERCA